MLISIKKLKQQTVQLVTKIVLLLQHNGQKATYIAVYIQNTTNQDAMAEPRY